MARYCPIQNNLTECVLHSTGQRNSFIEYVCWASKVKRLARTLIQSKSNSIQVRSREGGQIRCPRSVPKVGRAEMSAIAVA